MPSNYVKRTTSIISRHLGCWLDASIGAVIGKTILEFLWLWSQLISHRLSWLSGGFVSGIPLSFASLLLSTYCLSSLHFSWCSIWLVSNRKLYLLSCETLLVFPFKDPFLYVSLCFCILQKVYGLGLLCFFHFPWVSPDQSITTLYYFLLWTLTKRQKSFFILCGKWTEYGQKIAMLLGASLMQRLRWRTWN